MANAIDHLDHLIREELPRVMHESLPMIAPEFKQIETTSIDVIRDSNAEVGIGRGWKVIHLFETGVAGIFNYANPAGPAMTTVTNKMAGLQALGTAAANVAIFPTAEQSPHVSALKRELVLHMGTGNFSLPATFMQAEMLTAAQIKYVARQLKAVGKHHAVRNASSFFAYTASDGTYDVDVLGRISVIAEDGTFTDYVKITIDETYGRICHFWEGMIVDIVASSGGNVQTGTATDGTDVRNYTHTGAEYVQLTIINVDRLAKTLLLLPTNTVDGGLPNYGSGTTGDLFQAGQEGAADDWLVARDSSTFATGTRPMVTWGLEDWIKSSGILMGGASASEALDLTYYPQFKSQVIAVNAPLTETVLNDYVAGYLDAYPGETLDTILTTQGVTNQYLLQPTLSNNRFNFDRTGKELDYASGWQKITYSFNGRNLQWIASPMTLKSRLYSLKFGGGNIKKYVPPRLGGSDDRIGSNVEFLAPLTGRTGIFMEQINSAGQVLSTLQAPFWEYYLVAPTDPKAVKLTDLTESILV